MHSVDMLRMQTKASMEKAADIIAREGWTRAEYHHHIREFNPVTMAYEISCDGYCMMGAIRLAAGWEHGEKGLQAPIPETEDHVLERYNIVDLAETCLRLYLREHPTVWNDWDGRTKEEVILALQECASRL